MRGTFNDYNNLTLYLKIIVKGGENVKNRFGVIYMLKNKVKSEEPYP